MRIDEKNKNILFNCLFAIVAFFTLTATINLIIQMVVLIRDVIRYESVTLGTPAVLILVATLASLVGIGTFIATFFTKKISDRTLLIVQSLVILSLLIIFIIAVSDSASLSMVTQLQQMVNFVLLLCIYMYHYRQKEAVIPTEEGEESINELEN